MRRRRGGGAVLLLWLARAACRPAPPMAPAGRGEGLRLLEELFPPDGDDSLRQPLLVRFRNDRGRARVAARGAPNDNDDVGAGTADILARTVGATPARLTRQEAMELLNDADIDYIEYDAPVRLQGEIEPYALGLIQRSWNQSTIPPITDAGTCEDGGAFKIAILDSGIEADHPDIDCLGTRTCTGRTFGLNSSFAWSEPADDHGTMVAGIIAAIRKNGMGITGVAENVCLIVVRIFATAEDDGRLSDLLAGVAWAAEMGAQVINLSVGGSFTSLTERNFYEQLYDSGRVLVVAAAGNGGSSQPLFPASYSSVISVAASTPQLARAIFSQYNQYIDLTAPGVGILSTARTTDSDWSATLYSIQPLEPDIEQAFVAVLMDHSPVPQGIQGAIVECTNYGLITCEGDGGHVCLIERGENLYYEKAVSCQDSGGVMALIYDTEPGPPLNSSLGVFADDLVTIPVVGVSAVDGQLLLNEFQGQNIRLQEAPGYKLGDGTSFSAPYVTGSIAALWQACPLCKNHHILGCLADTALDLGDEGRDNEFGYGLLQTEAAYQCIQRERCCNPNVSDSPSITPSHDVNTDQNWSSPVLSTLSPSFPATITPSIAPGNEGIVIPSGHSYHTSAATSRFSKTIKTVADTVVCMISILEVIL